MYSAFDIAKYFLILADDDSGEMLSNLKLQKLLYYAQGVHLALTGASLFNERIFAWTHGPVVAKVYYKYQDMGSQGIPAPDPDKCIEIDRRTREILDEVFDVYGQFSAWKLRDLTHEEPPWCEVSNGEEISLSSLKSYFDTQLV